MTVWPAVTAVPSVSTTASPAAVAVVTPTSRPSTWTMKAPAAAVTGLSASSYVSVSVAPFTVAAWNTGTASETGTMGVVLVAVTVAEAASLPSRSCTAAMSLPAVGSV